MKDCDQFYISDSGVTASKKADKMRREAMEGMARMFTQFILLSLLLILDCASYKYVFVALL